MAVNLEYQDLLKAGVHFGHMTRKWDPRMAPYIFMEKNGIHIIDLNKTLASMDTAFEAMARVVRSGRKIMFVATKRQAQEIVVQEASRLKMPYVTERWLGGMLTNFATVRKSLKKMSSIDKLMRDEATFKNFAKRERLMITREREKLERLLGGISDLTRLPAALFIIDVKKEHIAVKEARKLGIPIFAMVDTNSNPNDADYPIPANDDAFKSIAIVMKAVGENIEQALQERKQEKEEQQLAQEAEAKKEADKASEETEVVAETDSAE